MCRAAPSLAFASEHSRLESCTSPPELPARKSIPCAAVTPPSLAPPCAGSAGAGLEVLQLGEAEAAASSALAQQRADDLALHTLRVRVDVRFKVRNRARMVFCLCIDILRCIVKADIRSHDLGCTTRHTTALWSVLSFDAGPAEQGRCQLCTM
jgi:hypothetical protein